MMHRKRRLTLLSLAVLLGACESGELATGPVPGDVRAAASVAGTASAGFHFLPPIASPAEQAGPVDRSLEPVVEICETAACDLPHASFASSGSTGAETVRTSNAHFIVNWNTGATGAVMGTDYLVRVRVGTTVLGSTWVRIVANGREARAADADNVLGVLHGRTLPIRFWIGESAVVPAAVVRVAVTPAAAEITAGETQQYVATAYDDADAVVTGLTTAWSSSDDGVAAIDGAGLATGMAAGQVAITATIQGVSGTAVLDVTAGNDPPPSGTWTFTTCGATGAFGPSRVQCTDAYAESPLAGMVDVIDGIQHWEVPASGTYRITATGARGASAAPSQRGGAGAIIAGEIQLAAGDVLAIVVGQQGSGQGSGWSGGGGGGSFVVRAGQPLVIAGGGGGAHNLAQEDGCNANTSPYGGMGSGGETVAYCFAGEHRGDQVSLGGSGSEASYGSGGAGFYGNGWDDRSRDGTVMLGQGGRSWANGMVGGVAPDMTPCSGPRTAFGGFGGGGSGEGCDGGGGGGGFSGGDGGFFGGGGGSYLLPGTHYVNEGHSAGDVGSVVIERVQ